MTFKLGLTGSIGMGKSTTAQMFKDLGCAVWDADAAVHRMYAKGGAAVAEIAKVIPDAIVEDAVSRGVLKQMIDADPMVLKRLETIVHPLVAKDRAEFMQTSSAEITVFDIPLLFELGSETSLDAVVCVTVPKDLQRKRVLARGTMTETQFETILAKQMSNDEKKERSDYIVTTDTLDHARSQVAKIVADIKDRISNA